MAGTNGVSASNGGGRRIAESRRAKSRSAIVDLQQTPAFADDSILTSPRTLAMAPPIRRIRERDGERQPSSLVGVAECDHDYVNWPNLSRR